MLVHICVPLIKLAVVQYNPWHTQQMALEESLNALVVSTSCLEEWNTSLTCVNVLMDVFLHTYPPEVMSHHVDCEAYSLVTFCIVKF